MDKAPTRLRAVRSLIVAQRPALADELDAISDAHLIVIVEYALDLSEIIDPISLEAKAMRERIREMISDARCHPTLQ